VNAFCPLGLERHLELARAEAHARERELEHDADVGPLHGVPVAVKDDLAVRGMPFTCGSRLREGEVAGYDDLTVARLRQAGAIILGKTNEPEFGHKGVTDNSLFGTTRNPWDLTRTAGGSSGGSAAAVAAGLAYLALGTDVGGSVRIPASCCGVVGLKPSLGRVPRVPATNAFVTQWFIGPLARTAADAALAMRVVAGPDDRDPFALPAGESSPDDLRGLRLVWCPRPTDVPADAEVAAAAERTVRLLERGGVRVTVREGPLPEAPVDALRVIFRAISLADAGIRDEADFRRKRDLLSDTFAAFVEPGLRLTLGEYLEAQARVTTFLEQAAPDYWRDGDVLATPTLAVPPFAADLPLGPEHVGGRPIDPQLGWAFTWPFNLTGQPAASVPCGRAGAGLPLGLQLVGRRGADGLVLRVAAAVEELAPWSDRRPLAASGG
jgi:Asp-tRNA(Asn)/Glu-tRNA(Gln) amidotransferase A subunit family amidase